jgi:predicted RNase H-like HicB family nuclease
LSDIGPTAIFQRMKPITYCIYRESEFFVAQCLNVDVSTFGTSREEAIANLKEAVELYFEGEGETAYAPVSDATVGQELVNA